MNELCDAGVIGLSMLSKKVVEEKLTDANSLRDYFNPFIPKYGNCLVARQNC